MEDIGIVSLQFSFYEIEISTLLATFSDFIILLHLFHCLNKKLYLDIKN